jgi:hypothetical protein
MPPEASLAAPAAARHARASAAAASGTAAATGRRQSHGEEAAAAAEGAVEAAADAATEATKAAAEPPLPDAISHAAVLAAIFCRLPPGEQALTVSRLSRHWRAWAAPAGAALRAAAAGLAHPGGWLQRLGLFQVPLWFQRECYRRLTAWPHQKLAWRAGEAERQRSSPMPPDPKHRTGGPSCTRTPTSSAAAPASARGVARHLTSNHPSPPATTTTNAASLSPRAPPPLGSLPRGPRIPAVPLPPHQLHDPGRRRCGRRGAPRDASVAAGKGRALV